MIPRLVILALAKTIQVLLAREQGIQRAQLMRQELCIAAQTLPDSMRLI
jgi:hypothetical protein